MSSLDAKKLIVFTTINVTREKKDIKLLKKLIIQIIICSSIYLVIYTIQNNEYVFSEGAIEMLDSYDKPARTMLTSEGSFSRTTHIVKDKKTGRIRLLTAAETERIQGFPSDHTKYCLVDGDVVEMPVNKRRFMMGNALVVNLIKDMEKTLDSIFGEE